MFVNNTLIVSVFLFFGETCHGAFLINEKLSHIRFSMIFSLSIFPGIALTLNWGKGAGNGVPTSRDLISRKEPPLLSRNFWIQYLP